MKRVKAIFFDLGNVIIKLNPLALEEGYAPYGDKAKGGIVDFVMDMDSDEINGYMEGKITSSQFYSRTKRIFKMDISFEDFYHVWNSMFDPYPEVEDIIRAIKRKYPDIKLVLVSNTNEAHYRFISENYDVLSFLDACVVSHEFGRQKPDRSIYNEALRLAGSLPKETFYTDDRPDLVDAARTMGIRAFQFTGHEELLAQLTKCGVVL